MAEWLRRLTRNQLGSPRVGSNPIHCVFFFFLFFFFYNSTSTSAYEDLTEFIKTSLKAYNSPSDGISKVKNNNKTGFLPYIVAIFLFQQNVIHRIAVESLGSPLWLQDTTGTATDLTCFLHRLRGIVREANAVAFITVPTHLFQVSK